MDEKEIYNKAIEVHGAVNQMLMCIEEMAELTVELCHFMRGRESNIAEELADVQITTDQMVILHGMLTTAQVKKEKLIRLDRRLRNEESGNVHPTDREG